MAVGEWVLLEYRLPREPSTPRIAVWRKLRRLGALQLLDGLVSLPADSRTKEQLEWIADEVQAAGGEAAIWTARPGSKNHERMLAARMAEQVGEEHRAATEEARAALREDASSRRRTLARLQRELHRVRARDYFPGSAAEHSAAAVAKLADAVAEEKDGAR
jgi:ubiquinone biosynthesis protein UbiJ